MSYYIVPKYRQRVINKGRVNYNMSDHFGIVLRKAKSDILDVLSVTTGMS